MKLNVDVPLVGLNNKPIMVGPDELLTLRKGVLAFNEMFLGRMLENGHVIAKELYAIAKSVHATEQDGTYHFSEKEIDVIDAVAYCVMSPSGAGALVDTLRGKIKLPVQVESVNVESDKG